LYSGNAIPLELEEKVTADDEEEEGGGCGGGDTTGEGDSVNTVEEDTIAVLNRLNIPERDEFTGEDPKEVLPSLDSLRSLVSSIELLLLDLVLSAGLLSRDERDGLGGGATAEEEFDLIKTGLIGAGVVAVMNNGDEIEGSCSASILVSLLILLEDDARTGFGGAAGLLGDGVAATVATAATAGAVV